MNRSNILAHRGWWDNEKDKNSCYALKRALDAGYGLETDVRDLNGKLVISHDPPNDDAVSTEWLFKTYVEMGVSGRIAINVKADGLQGLLVDEFKKSGLNEENTFVFDMAIPDQFGYLRLGLPTYTRVSEYEEASSLIEQTLGVWVDSFTGGGGQITQALFFMDKGYRVTIVSPELHKRDHLPLWSAIVKERLCENPLFEICTDFPVDFENYIRK